MTIRTRSRRNRQRAHFGVGRNSVRSAAREVTGRLNDAAALFGVVQRSLERQEIGSDEVTMLRQGIASLLLVHDQLDKLTSDGKHRLST